MELSQSGESLARREFIAAQFKRITKSGGPVWIQASYDPILDSSGKPYKIVKFATDITERVELTAKLRTVSALIDSNLGEIARAVNDATVQLSAFTKAMSGIVVLIQGIASQINLLALNATIEAARPKPPSRWSAVPRRRPEVWPGRRDRGLAQARACRLYL